MGSFTLAEAQAEEQDREAIRWGKVMLLVALLPLFGEVFHYVKGLPALWALSKAFPVLSLPLAIFIFRSERPPATRQMLVTLLYLVLVSSFMGIASFDQNFFLGLTAQVKLIPMLYFFSFLGLLRWQQPSMKELQASVLICAALTFITLILLWIFVPDSSYSTHYNIGDSPIFSIDDRGYRIRMPMYFGTVGLIYCFRLFFAEKRIYLKILWFLLVAGGITVVIQAVRNRSLVLTLVVLVSLIALRKTTPTIRVALLVIIPLAVLALFQIPYVASVLRTDQVRSATTAKAIAFLGTSPWNWLFGMGTITGLDQGGLLRFFSHFFFLADITWLGIVFEFGIVGALLILALPVRALVLGHNINPGKYEIFIATMKDAVLYCLIISPLYSMTLAPGEYIIMLAMIVYARERPECGVVQRT